MSDVLGGLSVIWVFSGVMWLRRAYVGEKPAAMITLNSPARKLSRRERLIDLGMAIMNFIVGGLSIWKAIYR